MKINNTKEITQLEKFRIMVYGNSGVGKTQLIGTIPGKSLVLNCDKGMKTLSSLDIDYVSANNWSEIMEFLNFMKKEDCLKTYEWIVFDSISAMMDLLYLDLSETKKLAGFDLWREYSNFVNKFMRVLRDQQNYHTLSICEAIDKEDDSGVATKGFGVQGQIGGRIPNFYDEVFALRIGKDNARMLQTASSSGWIAKDRSQVLEKNEVADLGVVMAKILKGK